MIDYSDEIMGVEDEGEYKVFYNFQKEELLRVKADFYPWLKSYFTDHLEGHMEIIKNNLDVLSGTLDVYINKEEKEH